MAYEKSSYNWKVVAHEYKSIRTAKLENEIRMNRTVSRHLSEILFIFLFKFLTMCDSKYVNVAASLADLYDRLVGHTLNFIEDLHMVSLDHQFVNSKSAAETGRIEAFLIVCFNFFNGLHGRCTTAPTLSSASSLMRSLSISPEHARVMRHMLIMNALLAA